MGKYFCNKFRHFGLTIVICRGVPRLDAPGERKKFGAPMFGPEVFQKQMCYLK